MQPDAGTQENRDHVTDDFIDERAITAIERITRGNVCLFERLLPQIKRVLRINDA